MRLLPPWILALASSCSLVAQTAVNDTYNVPIGETFAVYRTLQSANFNTAVISPITYTGPWAYHDDLQNSLGRNDPYPSDAEGDAWNSADFNTATSTSVTAWKTGSMPLVGGVIDAIPTATATLAGVGTGPSSQNLVNTYLFRNTFSATSAQVMNPVWLLNLVADDGAIVYLNGVEVARLNMATASYNPAGPLTPNTLTANGNEAAFSTLSLNLAGIIRPGLNTIAVEVHQTSLGSSDAGLDLSLVPGVSNESGFAYADNILGGTLVDNASGTLAATEGQAGSGALKVTLTDFPFGNAANSGGWVGSVSVPTAGNYRLNLSYRLTSNITNNNRNTNYGEAVLTVNGTRYGTGAGTSLARLSRVSGSNSTVTDDSGWQSVSLVVPLLAGANPVQLAAYQTDNRCTSVTNAWFDDFSVATEPGVGVLANDIGTNLTAQLEASPAKGTVALASDGGFVYRPNANATGTDFFTYRAVSGLSTTSPATVLLNLQVVNYAPDALPDAYVMDEDTALSVTAANGVLKNDSDRNPADTLTAVLGAGPAVGTLSLQSSGAFTYTPPANYSGKVTFTYLASDGGKNSAATTVTVTVRPLNDGPTAVADSYSTSTNIPLVVNDPGRPYLFYYNNFDTLVTPSAGGSGSLVPSGAFSGLGSGANTFSGDFLRNTSGGNPGQATEIQLTGLPAHNFVNLGFLLAIIDSWEGTAGPDTFNVEIDGVSVLSASFSNLSAATQGYTAPAASILALRQDLGFSTDTDAFKDSAYDASLFPELQNIAHTASTLTIRIYGSGAGWLGSDDESFAIDNLAVRLKSSATAGGSTQSLVAKASAWKYQSSATDLGTAWSGKDYNDTAWASGPGPLGFGETAGTLAAPTTIIPGNGTLPFQTVYFRREFTVDNPSLITALSGNIRRDDGAVVYINGVELARANMPTGAVVYNTGASTSVGNADEYAFFAYTGLAPALAALVPGRNVISVEVHQFGFPTTSSDITFDLELTAALSAPQGLLANDTDPDVGDDLFAEIVTSPTKGTLTLIPSGAFTYNPNPNVTGSDSFTYRVRDVAGLFSAPVTVSLTIVPGANTVPAVSPDAYSLNEDGTLTVLAANGVLVNDADLEGNPMTASVVSAPSVGTLNLSGDGSFTYAPPANYSGNVTFTYRVNDTFGNSAPATVTLTVNPINDAPGALADRYFTSSSGTLTVNAASGVLANDTDIDAGDTLNAVLVTQPAHGALTLNLDGSFSYLPASNFGGVDQFTYRARDAAQALSPAVTVFIEINNPPVGQNDAYTISEDARLVTTTLTGVLANDSDPDAGQTLSALLAALPSHGSVLLRSDGSFSYTPAVNYHGTDSFTYRLTDGRQLVGPYTVTLTINSVLNSPDARADSFDTYVDTLLTVTSFRGVLANDRSIEGGTLTASLVAAPVSGTLTLAPNGSFTYLPTAGYEGFDSFTYVASDNGPPSAPVTVTLNVKPAAERLLITEIMYNPAIITTAERTAGFLTNDAFEWFEIYNPTANALNLTGWTVSSGVAYSFPAGASLPAGARAVVAASDAGFRSRNPAYAGQLFAGWIGTLSNTGNKIALTDSLGRQMDAVSYYDSGLWSNLIRDTLLTSGGYNSWEWSLAADGDGRTLELVNLGYSNNLGGNWLPSSAVGGTPGAANSRNATNIAPVLSDLTQSPLSPKSTDPVVVTVRVRDESETAEPTVTLRWRVSTLANSNTFASLVMKDDGVAPDITANDGYFAATIPAQANTAVVEYYVVAQDAAALSRALGGTLDGAGNNAGPYLLYLVDNLSYSGVQPLYRLVMSEFDRNAYNATIVRTTDVAIPCTLVVLDGPDQIIRHQCLLRNRGAGSRGKTPYTMRLSFASDEPWNGATDMNLNAQYPASQVLGNRLCQLAGLPAPNARQIALRVNTNNVNSIKAASGVDFVPYVHVQPLDSSFVSMAFPTDVNGNIYTKRRPASGADTKWAYLSGNAESYIANGWSKGNNASANDWSDVDRLHAYLNNTNGVSPTGTGYAAAMEKAVDVNQWVRYFATNTIMYNVETSIANGVDDDYDGYGSGIDHRFQLVPHDYDTVLGQGDTPGVATGTLFPMVDAVGTSSGSTIMKRFIEDNTVCRRYYAELLRQCNTIFEPTYFNTLVDNYLANNNNTAVSATTIKTFANTRRNHIVAQIKTAFTLTHNLTVTNGYPTTTTPSTIVLSGNIPMATTNSVRLNGVTVTHNTKAGTWTSGDTSFPLTLAPGLNSLLVECLDEAGAVVASSSLNVVYDNSSNTLASVAATGTTTWTAAASPHRVTAALTVPAAATLVIEPGASVYFSDGASLGVAGKITVLGTANAPVTFTRLPTSTGKWNGLSFTNNTSDNRLENVRFLYGDGGTEWLSVISSKLTLVSCSWDNTGSAAPVTAKPVLVAIHPVLAVSKCLFPSASVAVVQGSSLSGSDACVFDGNTFAATPSAADIVSFSTAQRPGPVLEIRNNSFLGSGDDLLDLTNCDALIEGNTFKNAKLAGAGPNTANAIAASGTSDVSIVRNTMLDNNNGVLLTSGARATFAHNTVVTISGAALVVSENGGAAGLGATVTDSIFTDCASLTAGTPSGVLTLARSLVPVADVSRGISLRSADPLFVNRTAGNYTLRPESVGTAASSLGLNLGSGSPAGVAVFPVPTGAGTAATLSVGGPGLVSYRWRLGSAGAWSAAAPVATPLTLSGLPPSGLVTLQVEGLDAAGRWTPDASAKTVIWSQSAAVVPVVFSEVLAVNTATYGDGVSDYLEFVNNSDTAFDLAGFRLSDDTVDALNPAKFTFAAGSTIPARGFLVLSSLQLGFNLAESGETLHFYGPAASGDLALQSLKFGWQLPGYSSSLRADGQWVASVPTLGAANLPAVVGSPLTLKVNEWLARGGLAYDQDFVELYNPAALPVLLSAVTLSDTFVSGDGVHTFAVGSLIPAAGYRAFRADGGNSGDHLTFKLSYQTGHLILRDYDAAEIDRLTYTTQQSGRSQGRTTDGASTFSFFSPPTPGFSNSLSASEALLINNLRITELMYAPAGDADAEFIEFTNIGASALNLAGVTLANGVNFTFPAGSSLAGGASGVIIRSNASFAGAHGTSANILGVYTGRLDNSGERIRLETPRGLGILDFSYDPAWQPATAGNGSSLEVINPSATAASWNLPTQWRASLLGGGSPGGSVTLAVDAGADASLNLPSAGVLRGVVSSDVPVSSLVTTWSQLSGPALATLDSPDQIATYATFPQTGSYVFRFSVTSGATVRTDDIAVSVLSNSVTYTAWQNANFTAGQLADPQVSGPDADPDHDGVPNLVELLLGRNPLGTDTGVPPVLKSQGGVLVFDYPRPSSTNLVVEAQWASSPAGPWFSGAGYVTETTLSDDGATRVVRVQIDSSRTDARQFIRLHLVNP